MFVRPLSAELRVIAEKELNETPKRLEDGINHLREWITMQPHLRAQRDDQWLAAFLRGCKYSVEKAKTKLDLYYTLRTISPDLFTLKHNDQMFLKMIKMGSLLILPKTTTSGDPRVVLIRPGRIDRVEYRLPEFISFSLTCQQLLYLDDDVFMVNGTINIIDLAGVTTTHVMQMTPTIMKKFHVATQDAAPMRLKRMYFINTPPVFEKLFWNIAVQLLSDNSKERIHVTSKGVSALYDIIGRDIFPEECGGNAGTEQEIAGDLLNKLQKYGPWLDEDLKCGTDEARRPGKPKTAADMFGVDGTFRQLEVD